MRAVCWIWFCAGAVTAADARAEESGTSFQYEPKPGISGNVLVEDPATFWERFKVVFDHRAAGMFEDQFHPLNFVNWEIQWKDRDFNHLSEHNAGMARHAFADAFRSSARDAALSLDLPGLEWLRERQGFLPEFLWYSLDSVEEQSVSPLNPSYRSVERSWWSELSEGGRLRYGVRPFRTDPYAFLSWRIKDGDSVWLLGNARYYFRNFGDHCFELALSAPIARGFSIDLGTSCQFGRHRLEKKAVLKLLKTFKSGGVLNVALEAQQHPTLYAGITVPW